MAKLKLVKDCKCTEDVVCDGCVEVIATGTEECQHTEGFDHWVCNACGESKDPPDLDYGDD